MEVKVARLTQTRVFMEGPEVCREYFRTARITFGSSYLLPGQKGATDPGHNESNEVFFVSKGHVLLETHEGSFYELYEGDAVIIPAKVPHTLSNIGEVPALITWSLAPGESPEEERR